MKIIKVHSSTRTYNVKVDDKDYPELMRWHWIWRNGYAVTRMDGRYYQMHRFIMDAPYGEPIIIDHIDTDHTNNQRSNLRRADRFQNQQNRRTNRKNKLPKGIRLLPSGKYNVRLQGWLKREVFGNFDTVEEAVEARNKRAIELHGEFFRASHLLDEGKQATPAEEYA